MKIEVLGNRVTMALSDVADPAVGRAIAAPLVQYNESQAGPSGSKALVIELRQADGAVIGGLWGATAYEWLYVQWLAVPESLRGQGVGRRIMLMAEAEAVARGCHSAWLDTFEFQARGFYEKLGYTCFGSLDGYPKGFSRFFMRKDGLKR